MRKLFSILAFTAMLAPAAALAGAAGGDAQQSPMDRMAEQLGLTEQQQSEIEAIIEEQQQKQMALRQETQEQIDEVLTDDQRAKLEEIQQQRQEQMRRRMEEMQKQRGESGGAEPR
ncbi:MAG: hypothetical protein U5P41_02850 [Gammaproteobacteria bacterium]|nr:hypothetical protein [Gammaproteobacteria bacterium]